MTHKIQSGKSKSRKALVRWILILAAMTVGMGASLIYRDALWMKVSGVLAASDDDPIPVQKLEKSPFQLNIPAYGEITGLESTPVPTPSTRGGGLKVAWLIPEGSFVREGDVIARFDNVDARLNLETQQNTMQMNQEKTKVTSGKQTTDEKVLGYDRKDAEEEYEYAMTVLPQDETIFSKWAIIEAKINAGFAKDRIGFLTNKGKVQKRIARSDQQILAIERNKAQAEIAIAQQTLDALELKTPKGGLVLYRRDRGRDPQVGDETWPGQILLEIIDMNALQARTYVLERDAGSLAKGNEVLVRLDSIPEKEYHGTVRSMATLAQPLERNSPLKYFICEVTIRDAGEDMKRIKPGMSLKADVVLERYDSCFVVPSSAITTKGADATVYIKQKDRFVARQVKLGSGTHGQSTILEGVKDGEMIAMRNPFEVRKAYLPDFSKAQGTDLQRPMGGGPRIFMR
jgi:multidrug efflux pump subunit AcrA (membrane-fusion protein)